MPRLPSAQELTDSFRDHFQDCFPKGVSDIEGIQHYAEALRLHIVELFYMLEIDFEANYQEEIDDILGSFLLAPTDGILAAKEDQAHMSRKLHPYLTKGKLP